MTGYTSEAVVKMTGEFMMYSHNCHDVVSYNDLSDDEGTIEDSLKDVQWSKPDDN